MADIKRDDINHVAYLTMTSPGTLNALGDAMLAALQDALDQIAKDPDIRVVVIAAEGRAYCAGHNLREMQAARQAPDKGAAKLSELFDTCAKLMLSIQRMPQPVIAQVHAMAAAAGCQLVATCDMAVAADTARFGVNGVNIGLFCSTPMVALTRAVPSKVAFEMLTTGRFANVDEALRMGLINKVVPEDDLAQATRELAETVAGKLSAAVKVGKRAFYEQIDMPTEQAYNHTGKVIVENILTADTAEGIAAFLEKRAPEWDQ